MKKPEISANSAFIW